MDDPASLKNDYTYRPPKAAATATAAGDPLAGVLGPGEKLLWSGTPPQDLIVLRDEDPATLSVAIVWTVFSLGFEVVLWLILLGGSGNLSVLGLALFGLFLAVIGPKVLWDRFAGDLNFRRSAHYALTDQRAVIATAGRKLGVLSIPLDEVERVGLKHDRHGKGTITFEGVPFDDGPGSALPAFQQVEDPGALYNSILRAQGDLIVKRHGTPEAARD